MKFQIVLRNGDIIPTHEAVIHIESIETVYGFGVYETIKLRKGVLYFLPQHIQRLFHSAQSINLQHTLTSKTVTEYIEFFITKLETDSCNLKLVLYGGSTVGEAQLFITASSPHYPDKKWYRLGVSLMSYTYERFMPQAKTLNMLPSYYIYSKAKENGCYDALLVSKNGNILEGTRTNVYGIKGKHIVSPKKEDILEGVTMMTLEKVLKKTDFSLTYQDIPFSTIFEYDALFISSTSSKILPVCAVDTRGYPPIPQSLQDLIQIYERSLDRCSGVFELL